MDYAKKKDSVWHFFRADHEFEHDGVVRSLRSAPSYVREAAGFRLVRQSSPSTVWDLATGEAVGVEQPDGTVLVTYATTRLPIDKILAKKLESLEQHRWTVEIGGTEWNGIMIATDRESRKNLRDTRDSLAEGILDFVRFKGPGGTWVLLTDASQVAPLLSKAAVHVRDAFAQEQAHTETLRALADDGDTEGLIAHDIKSDVLTDYSTGWPAVLQPQA